MDAMGQFELGGDIRERHWLAHNGRSESPLRRRKQSSRHRMFHIWIMP